MKRSLTLMPLIFTLIACQKKESTTTGNPMVSLSMASSQQTTAVAAMSFGDWLQRLFFPLATASAPNTAITDAVGNTLTLDHGWMVVKEVEFKTTEVAGADEIDGTEIQFMGPYVVDLFSASVDVLGSTPISTPVIRRIKMKLHALDTVLDGAPNALVSNSIYFHGLFGTKEFSITSQEGTEFEIGGSTGLTVHDNMNLLLAIRIIPLINKIDLTLLGSQASGVVISDSNKIPDPNGGFLCPSIDPSATTIYDCFKKGLEQEAELGEDSDNSGEIESGEDCVRKL